MTMTESTSELALSEKLSQAQDETRQAKADLEESAKRVAMLEAECAKRDAADEKIRALEDQIEDFKQRLKNAEEAYTVASSPELGSPKTQSEEGYVVVEPGSPGERDSQLKQREEEIKKAIAHAKKLEEVYNTAEERALSFERQVHVLEANMFEKFDDANALLEKVKELEELLTAGQIQIATLEEKSKISDEAQKKVEYEKVLFLETEDQLVKNFKKAHDEAEQYRNMILQLETCVKIAEEKATYAEKCMEFASQRNQELESEIADLNFQILRICRRPSLDEGSKLEPDPEILELLKALDVRQDQVDSMEQELLMYRDGEKKVDDDVRSVDEKNVVHEASSSHPADTLQGVSVGEPMTGRASSSVRELDLDPGKSTNIGDEMKFLGENVESLMTHSKQLKSELSKLQSAHIRYSCEAETSKTELKDLVKDLEAKLGQLEQEILATKESEERMKVETKAMEAKAMEDSSFFEGLKMSYADYTSNLEMKNSTLEEQLIIFRKKIAAFEIEQQNWALEYDRTKNAERRSESLESLVVELQTKLEAPRVCDLCPQLKTHIEDAENRVESLEIFVIQLQTNLEAPRECDMCPQLKRQIQDLERKRESLEASVVELQTNLEALRECDMCPQLKTQIQDAERKRESLEASVVELQTKLEAPKECDMCSQLKSQIQDLELMLGELSLELEVSRTRENDVQVEVKSMEEKIASLEQLASELKEKAASQVTDYDVRVQELEAQMKKLQEENLLAQTCTKENRLWAEEAASLLREHADSLHELRGEYAGSEHRLTAGKSLDKEEKEALEAKVEQLHLLFRDVHLCDGSESLQMCKELLSLERDSLNFQMLDIACRKTNLEDESEDLKLQIQKLQNPPELPVQEAKKSFREASLEGEVRSLGAQLKELEIFRARVSEIPSLQKQLAQLRLSLRASESKELKLNLELAKVRTQVSAAEEEVSSLKSTLLNQTQLHEFQQQINRLEEDLMKSEATNAALVEEIVNVSSRSGLHVEVPDNATDEVDLDEAPEPEEQAQNTAADLPKPKARKRRNRKGGKAMAVQETIQAADGARSFRHRISVFLFFVFLVAVVLRFLR